MSDTQREMTLEEWCARLPVTHKANVELNAMIDEIEQLKRERESCYVKWQEKYANLKRERDELKTLLPFIEGCIECCFDGLSYDGGDIQDALTDIGALVIEPYDPNKHVLRDFYELDAGDDLYVVAPWLKEQLRKGEL